MTDAPGRADPDSRARTHLANERTFLAWLRTGLAMLALGFAASEFLPQPGPSEIDLAAVMSIVLVLGGLGMAGVGGLRYTRATKQIDAGRYQPSSGMVLWSVGLTGIVGILVLIFVVVYH
jgi:putative membrane protein